MKERIFEGLAAFCRAHRGPCLGMALGLLFAAAVLLLGFFPTIFLVLCGGLGWILGGRIEAGASDQLLARLRDRLPERIQYWHWGSF